MFFIFINFPPFGLRPLFLGILTPELSKLLSLILFTTFIPDVSCDKLR